MIRIDRSLEQESLPVRGRGRYGGHGEDVARPVLKSNTRNSAWGQQGCQNAGSICLPPCPFRRALPLDGDTQGTKCLFEDPWGAVRPFDEDGPAGYAVSQHGQANTSFGSDAMRRQVSAELGLVFDVEWIAVVHAVPLSITPISNAYTQE